MARGSKTNIAILSHSTFPMRKILNFKLCSKLRTFFFHLLSQVAPPSLLLGYGVVAAHALSIGSSSFVEEEHQTWYFFGASLAAAAVILAAFRGRWLASGFCVLLIDRLARAMNQTGDKWSHLPDLSDWLLQ